MTTLLAADEAPAVLYEHPHWYACYTHGRHEKRVSFRLKEAGIESYLPLRVERRRWTDRVRDVELPMFASYVFAYFRLGALGQVLNIRGVASTVRVGITSYPTPIPESEIDHVRLAAEQARRYGLEPEIAPCLEKGHRVRVVSGVFRGVEGVVIHQRGRTHLLVGLSAIGQGLKVQVERDDLEPLKF